MLQKGIEGHTVGRLLFSLPPATWFPPQANIATIYISFQLYFIYVLDNINVCHVGFVTQMFICLRLKGWCIHAALNMC